MTARFRKLLITSGDVFWLVPSLMVRAGVLLAIGLVALDRSGVVPEGLLQSAWLYNGGGTGARTLLVAVAPSTISVAGTVFSITIAALSLAAGQMGRVFCGTSPAIAATRSHSAPSSVSSHTLSWC